MQVKAVPFLGVVLCLCQEMSFCGRNIPSSIRLWIYLVFEFLVQLVGPGLRMRIELDAK